MPGQGEEATCWRSTARDEGAPEESTGLALSLLVLDAEGALAEAVARALLREEGIARATGASDPGVAVATLERAASTSSSSARTPTSGTP